MQSPTIVFDHIHKVFAAVQPGPTQDQATAAAVAAQRDQVTTSSGVPSHRG